MFTAEGSLGTANNKSSGTFTLSMSPASNVAVDQLVVVWIGWDSIFSVFVPDDYRLQVKVTDSAGNIYTAIGYEVDRSTFFGGGAFAAIYIAQLRNALTTSDTITAEGGGGGLIEAKSMSVEEFTLGAGLRWASAGFGRTEDRGVDPTGISFDTGIAGREFLWLYALGAEGPDSDTYTLDADYTAIVGTGTTGGAADTNVHIRGGYRIEELSADSLDVTSNTADRDYSQVLAAVCEVETMPFPRSPVLDDFNRADEDPLDGGLWDTTIPAYGSGGVLSVVGNAAAGQGGSFFDEFFENCVEAYVTLTDYEDTTGLHIHADGNASLTTMSGWGAEWSAADGNAIGGMWAALGRSRNQGEGVAPFFVTWVDGFDGAKFGIQRLLKNDIAIHHLWVDIGDGWEELAAYVMTDTTTNNGGRLALMNVLSAARMDDFGGGQVPCRRRRPQIYRLVQGRKRVEP